MDFEKARRWQIQIAHFLIQPLAKGGPPAVRVYRLRFVEIEA